MVNFNFGGQHTRVPCFEVRFPKKDSDGNVTKKISAPVWIPLELDIEKQVSDIELKMNFDIQPNEDVPAQHSKGAFFVAHLDCPIETDDQVGEFEYEVDGHDARVSIDDWEFGSNPRLRLKFPNGNGCSKLQIMIGFIGAISNRRNPSKDIHVNLEYRCIEQNAAHFAKDYEVGAVMSYEFKSENRPRASDVFVEIWKGHNVFRVKGNGNSIHPKQTMTIHAISKFIKKWQSKEKIKIAYIGTDSTENISSLLRALKHKKLTKKIQSLSIFYDEKWDEHQLYKIRGQESRIIGVMKKKTKLIKMVSDHSEHYNFFNHDDHLNEIGVELGKVDLIVSTYVAPWADEDENSRARYKNLIQKLWIRNKTALISVDPVSGANIFRSIPNHFNLQRLYSVELELTNRLEYVKMGSEPTFSVECMLYRDPRGGVANG